MEKEITILITEDDEGHAALIKKNLRRAGITNEFIHFMNGEELIDYLLGDREKTHNHLKNHSYLLLLDLKMPKMSGEQALKIIKSDPLLKKMPVIILTTTDDPREVEVCHLLGCNCYITKPIDYQRFSETLLQLGMYFKIIQVPRL